MEAKRKKARLYKTIAAITGWFALTFQLYLMLDNRVATLPETILRYFSFYTILTNLLVALYFTFLLLRPYSRWGVFISRPAVSTGIAVYIVMVGLVYNLVLRSMWNPTGLQMLLDELLHVAIPLLYLFYFFIFANHAWLKWNTVFSWLLYPLAYVVCILLRGIPSGFYPYPFLNVNTLGYSRVLLNTAGLFIAFFFLSLLLIYVTRTMNKKRSGSHAPKRALHLKQRKDTVRLKN